MSYKSLLNEEICEELKETRKLNIGTDNYDSSINGTTKLIDRQIELEKLEMQRDQQIFENEMKVEQLHMEKKDRRVKNVLTGLSVIGGLAMYGFGIYASAKVEEEGSFTTLFGRTTMSNLSKMLFRK